MSYSWGAADSPARRESSPAVPTLDRETAGAVGAARPEPPPGLPVQADLVMRRVAAELAPMVRVWERLIAEHVPNRQGRCRTCTKGGTGVPTTPWPCSIYGIAEMARRRYDGEPR